MNFVSPLDELKVGGKLIKTLYLSILEKIRSKELFDNFNKFSNSKTFQVLVEVLDRDAGIIELEVVINPQGESAVFINSDVIMREEKIPILFDEGTIGL